MCGYTTAGVSNQGRRLGVGSTVKQRRSAVAMQSFVPEYRWESSLGAGWIAASFGRGGGAGKRGRARAKNAKNQQQVRGPEDKGRQVR